MEKDLVSIIILSYKNLKYIKEMIYSALSQDYENLEIIIGDDSTPDFDTSIYEEYIKKYNRGNIKNLKIYSNKKNEGIVKNLNKAISMCSGTYIKWMAADDIFYSDTVISQLVKFIKKTDGLLLASNIQFCDNEMNELSKSKNNIEKYRKTFELRNDSKKFLKKLSKGNCISAPGVLYTRELINRYGLFDEDYILLEDWPTWIRLCRLGCKIEYVDIISVKYRDGSGISTSGNSNPIFDKDKMKCIQKEILPYKKEIGYWLHKNINYQFVRQYKFNEYTLAKKILFLIKNIEILFINQINKIKHKLKFI